MSLETEIGVYPLPISPDGLPINHEHSLGITGLAEFLEQAKAAVSADWNTRMVTKLGEYTDLFPDQAALLTILERDDFRKLEKLRYQGRPELWRELVLDISQREIAILNHAKKMVSSLSEGQIGSFGLNRHEINLYLDLALAVQPHIDAAYHRQLELADQPGGKESGPHAREDGYGYLYEEKRPYIQVFAEHGFPALVTALKDFAARTSQAVSDRSLPPIYQELSSYLSLLAANFESQETNPKQLKQNWDNISEVFVKLAQSGCPIVLVPWGFMLDGDHIGNELMVALNLGTSSRYYKKSADYTAAVTQYMKKYQGNFKAIPFVHLYTLARNGDCLPWGGTACAGDFSIVMYDYENDRYARNIYRSYFIRYVDSDTTEEEFVRDRAENTIAHEVGHLGRSLLESIYRRIGVGVATGEIDESKADLMGIIYYLRNLFLGRTKLKAARYIEQYIVGYIEEFINSYGHEQENIGDVWYAFDGKLLLHHLYEHQAVRAVGDKFKVVEEKALPALRFLAELGQQVFDLYGTKQFKKPELNAMVGAYKEDFRRNLGLQWFLRRIYRDHGLIAA